MATSRHDASQQEEDDVTTPNEAVPAHDVTECTTYSDVISTPDAAVTEQTCTALGRIIAVSGCLIMQVMVITTFNDHGPYVSRTNTEITLPPPPVCVYLPNDDVTQTIGMYEAYIGLSDRPKRD